MLIHQYYITDGGDHALIIFACVLLGINRHILRKMTSLSPFVT